MRTAYLVTLVPFVGLATLPATMPILQGIQERRARCMEAEGWTLIDIVSGAPQQIGRDTWGDITVTPRPPAP